MKKSTNMFKKTRRELVRIFKTREDVVPSYMVIDNSVPPQVAEFARLLHDALPLQFPLTVRADFSEYPWDERFIPPDGTCGAAIFDDKKHEHIIVMDPAYFVGADNPTASLIEVLVHEYFHVLQTDAEGGTEVKNRDYESAAYTFEYSIFPVVPYRNRNDCFYGQAERAGFILHKRLTRAISESVHYILRRMATNG